MRFCLFLTLCATFLTGCGGPSESGPERFRVFGKVTFSGQPVKAGTIYFQPTTGPAGSAQIVDGTYDTSNGQGIVGGPHKIMIEGFDGAGSTDGELGKPIFNPQTIEEDLPKADTEKNFDIPASAAEGLIISNDPA